MTRRTSPPLRVLLGVAWYLPESIGGTEKYVRGLAMRLRARGVDAAIALPSAATTTVATDVQDGIRVFRFAPTDAYDFEIDTPAPPRFLDVLEMFSPTVVDVHSLTSHLGLPHLKAARAAGARTVVTVHLPGLVCARGTLLRFGREQCDGDLARQPCTACRLEARGVPAPVGALLSEIPDSLETLLERVPMPGVARRAIAADDAHEARLRWIRAIDEHADRLVVVSGFLKTMLERNGIASDKIVVCRHGVEQVNAPERTPGTREPDTLKVGFVGRFDPVKGLDVLLDAVERLPPHARIEVHIWGAARTPDARAYQASVFRNLHAMRQVVFHGEAHSLTPFDDVDLLVVPSVWAETGPFVVLEAHAAGLPVIGSDLGGIAERVIPGRNGLLFPVGDSRKLAEILFELWRDPVQLEQLRPREPMRTADDVASDTLKTYANLVSAGAIA